ncbi:hypothetical protein [Candidatus Vondammii sp. HM_W22]|uniref:hypothetical protein n=1 Tax=Candidatus Vondammii sp. HM_W22 TaxID=2687299 RepID=UPI002E7AAFEA|nr:hypothetical protein [Candidatus Vondammii sp. HM_W22]
MALKQEGYTPAGSADRLASIGVIVIAENKWDSSDCYIIVFIKELIGERSLI